MRRVFRKSAASCCRGNASALVGLVSVTTLGQVNMPCVTAYFFGGVSVETAPISDSFGGLIAGFTEIQFRESYGAYIDLP